MEIQLYLEMTIEEKHATLHMVHQLDARCQFGAARIKIPTHNFGKNNVKASFPSLIDDKSMRHLLLSGHIHLCCKRL